MGSSTYLLGELENVTPSEPLSLFCKAEES